MFRIRLDAQQGVYQPMITSYNTKTIYFILRRIQSKLREITGNEFSIEVFQISFKLKIEGEIQDRNGITLQILHKNFYFPPNTTSCRLQNDVFNKISLLPSKVSVIEGSYWSGKTQCFEIFRDKLKKSFHYYIPFKIIDTYNRVKYELDLIKSIKEDFTSIIVFFDDFDSVTNTVTKEKVLKFILKNYNSNIQFIITTTQEIKELDITDLFPLIRTRIGVPDKLCLFEAVSSLVVGHCSSPDTISEIAECLVGLHIGEVIDTVNKAIYLNADTGHNEKGFCSTVQSLVKFRRKTKIGEDILQLNTSKLPIIQTYGYKEEKEAICKVIQYPTLHKELYKELHLRPTKGILLFGPPGCSKTTMIKEITSNRENIKKYFVHIKGPEFYNKYVGKSEQKLSEVFALAKRYSPSILFFDEIDSIASSRSNIDKTCSRILGQLLVELDGIEGLSDVLFIAATNNPDKIDSALLRKGRIDEVVYLGPPSETSRHEILENLMDNELLKIIDREKFVKLTKNFTGAEMQFLINEINIEGLDAWENIVKRQTIICTKEILKYYRKWSKKYKKFIK